MGRPKKVIGNTGTIECAACGSKSTSGYRVSFILSEAEVTADFFVAYNPDVADYDAFFCSKNCILEYLKEELKNERSGNNNVPSS